MSQHLADVAAQCNRPVIRMEIKVVKLNKLSIIGATDIDLLRYRTPIESDAGK